VIQQFILKDAMTPIQRLLRRGGYPARRAHTQHHAEENEKEYFAHHSLPFCFK
jgi:hypothetical protein